MQILVSKLNSEKRTMPLIRRYKRYTWSSKQAHLRER